MKKSRRIAAFIAALVMGCTAAAPVNSFAAASVRPSSSASSSSTTGFVKKDGVYYYYKDGKMVKSSFIKHNDKWYYFLSTGKMATSWVKIGDTYYKFGTDGIMLTGWQKLDGKQYYFGGDGKMRTGSVKIGELVYNFSSAGVWDGKAGVGAAKSTSSSTNPPTSANDKAKTTASPTIKYGCSMADVIAVKGLKKGQYETVGDSLLAYQSKFLGYDAVTIYFFDKGKMLFYSTSIPSMNLSSSEISKAFSSLESSCKKSYGDPDLTAKDNSVRVWELDNELLMIGNTGSGVVYIHMSSDYADEIIENDSFDINDFLK